MGFLEPDRSDIPPERPMRSFRTRADAARRLPAVPAVPDASAMLDVLGLLSPVHSERLLVLRDLQRVLTPDNRLSAVITEDHGYPALSVARLDGGGSLMVGCAYNKNVGEWWIVTGWGDETRWLVKSNHLEDGAHAIKETLAGGRGRDW